MSTPSDQRHLPFLLQIFDSAFPTGGYAHSFGLEGMVQLGEIRNESEFENFLRTDVFYSLSRIDLPLFRLAYEAYVSEDFNQLIKLDELAYATKGTSEIRQASSRIGKQFLILMEKISADDADKLSSCTFIKNHLKYQQINTALGSICAAYHVPLLDALESFAVKTIHAFGQASIKLLHFGPYQVQKLMYQQQNNIAEAVKQSLLISYAEIGSNSPRWDIASAMHEHAHARMFIS